MEAILQPEPGQPPLALDRGQGNPEILGDLLEGEAIEEVEVHDLRLAVSDLLEEIERLAEVVGLKVALPADPERLVKASSSPRCHPSWQIFWP
jgi:hypothetical protein